MRQIAVLLAVFVVFTSSAAAEDKERPVYSIVLPLNVYTHIKEEVRGAADDLREGRYANARQRFYDIAGIELGDYPELWVWYWNQALCAEKTASPSIALESWRFVVIALSGDAVGEWGKWGTCIKERVVSLEKGTTLDNLPACKEGRLKFILPAQFLAGEEFGRGLIVSQKEDFSAAAEAFSESIRLYPSPPAYYNAGKSLLGAKKDPERAIRYFREHLKSNPPAQKVREVQGFIALLEKQLEEASTKVATAPPPRGDVAAPVSPPEQKQSPAAKGKPKEETEKAVVSSVSPPQVPSSPLCGETEAQLVFISSAEKHSARWWLDLGNYCYEQKNPTSALSAWMKAFEILYGTNPQAAGAIAYNFAEAYERVPEIGPEHLLQVIRAYEQYLALTPGAEDKDDVFARIEAVKQRGLCLSSRNLRKCSKVTSLPSWKTVYFAP